MRHNVSMPASQHGQYVLLAAGTLDAGCLLAQAEVQLMFLAAETGEGCHQVKPVSEPARLSIIG